MISRSCIALAAALALGGRGPASPLPAGTAHVAGSGKSKSASDPARPVSDSCGASKLDGFLNLLTTTDTLDSIRATVGHKRVRVVEPGDAVTMDYRPDRLNVENGNDGRISRFRCG